jgi:hypothetical protein
MTRASSKKIHPLPKTFRILFEAQRVGKGQAGKAPQSQHLEFCGLNLSAQASKFKLNPIEGRIVIRVPTIFHAQKHFSLSSK